MTQVNIKMRTTGWERCHLKERKNVGGKWVTGSGRYREMEKLGCKTIHMEWTFLRKKIQYAEEKGLVINQSRLWSSGMYTLQSSRWAPLCQRTLLLLSWAKDDEGKSLTCTDGVSTGQLQNSSLNWAMPTSLHTPSNSLFITIQCYIG